MFYWKVKKVEYMVGYDWRERSINNNFPRAYAKSKSEIEFEIDAFMDVTKLYKHLDFFDTPQDYRLRLVVDTLEKDNFLKSFMFSFRERWW